MVFAVLPITASASNSTTVTVCGTTISDTNASDVLGDGHISYDKENAVLNLNGASLTHSGGAAIITDGDLTVNLTGNNTVTASISNEGIHIGGSLTLRGSGSLTVRLTDNIATDYIYGCYTENNFTVDGCTLNVTASDTSGGVIVDYGSFSGRDGYTYGIYTKGNLNVKNSAKVTATGGNSILTTPSDNTINYGDSYGIYVRQACTIERSANVTTTGGNVTLSSTSGANYGSSYGLYILNGLTVKSSSSLTAIGGNANSSGSGFNSNKSYGLYSSIDYGPSGHPEESSDQTPSLTVTDSTLFAYGVSKSIDTSFPVYNNITLGIKNSDAINSALATDYVSGIKLMDNITVSQPIQINRDFNLDLNGYVLKYANEATKGSVITVNGEVEFTLTDSDTENTKHYFTKNTNGLWVLDDTQTSSPYFVTGGVITGGTNSGVYLPSSTTNGTIFNMKGGNIAGCSAEYGGGVFVYGESSTFNMLGGSIVGCTAISSHPVFKGDGGAIMNAGTFTINGGTISDCVAGTERSNAIYNSSLINFKSGTISGNMFNNDTGRITCVTHDYEWKTANGKYWQKCGFCGDETAKKDIPDVTITGADTVCRTQDYTFGFESDEIFSAPSEAGYEFIMLGSGVPVNADGTYTVKSEWYSRTENSFFVSLYLQTEDGFTFRTEKEVTISDNHTGGTATCTEPAECEICGEDYGDVDADNHAALRHTEAKAATVTSEGNIEYWHCEDCDKYFSDRDCQNEITYEDTVIAKLTESESASPKTGDTSHPALWIAVLFVSGGALTATGIYGKKRKHSAK